MSDSRPISGASPSSTSGVDAPRIAVATPRVTPRGPGFREVLVAASPLLKGAEAAASVLPGAPLVAAAIKAPLSMGSGGTSTYSLSTSVGSSVSGGSSGVSSATPSGGGAASSGPSAGGAGDPLGAPTGSASLDDALAKSQAMNIQMLELQEQMAAENRQYTTISNVLKARHDTVKNAIGNIR